MRRHELSDEQWDTVEALLEPVRFDRPSSRGDRNFVNAVVWIAKTGAPWRDLPERFGHKPVIAVNPSRKNRVPLNRRLYRLRYRVEVFFHSLKRFRRAATRYEKTTRNYLGFLACGLRVVVAQPGNIPVLETRHEGTLQKKNELWLLQGGALAYDQIAHKAAPGYPLNLQ